MTIEHNDMEIIHVTFRWLDSIIEIAYTESRNISTNASKTEIVMIDPNVVPEDELNDLLDTLRGIVDRGLVEIRNPAAEL